MSNDQAVDQAIQEMAMTLAQGIDPYAVIGKLYVESLTKQQAIALAVQTLTAFKGEMAPPTPEPPSQAPKVDPSPSARKPRAKRR